MTIHNAIKMMKKGDSWPVGNMGHNEICYARSRFGYICEIKNGRFIRKGGHVPQKLEQV